MFNFPLISDLLSLCNHGLITLYKRMSLQANTGKFLLLSVTPQLLTWFWWWRNLGN